MKIVQRIIVCLFFTTLGMANTPAASAEEMLASYRFVGTTALAGTTNGSRLKEILALPETVKFRDDVFRKLARVSVKYFGADSGNSSHADLLQPLFEDLVATESLLELRGLPKARPTLILAVRLDEKRSRLWETNLQQLVKASKPQPAKINNATGWQAKAGTHVLKFVRADQWTVLVLGPEQTPSQSAFVNQLQKPSTVAAGKTWLEAKIDWPKLNGLLPLDKSPFKLAHTEVQVSGTGENLRTTARVIYPEKIDWNSEAWRIPKELILEPLISFSAAQKIGPFLQRPIVPAQTASNPQTNQIFFWAQSQMPFQSYFAMPVQDATNTLRKLGPQWMAAFNDALDRRDGGKLQIVSNRVDLVWQGVPIIVPFLKPAQEKTGAEFLLGGLFPIVPNTNKAPAELFKQITGRPDLVYYDWEITQERLGQWTMLSQLLPIFSKQSLVTTNEALRRSLGKAKMMELNWISTVGPKLGNTITEVTRKSPTELSVVRKSHIGLNSLELVLLTHWLAHPDFPRVNPFAAAPKSSSSKP